MAAISLWRCAFSTKAVLSATPATLSGVSRSVELSAEEAVARQQAEAERRRIALEAAEERVGAADRLARRTRVGLLVMWVLLAIAAGLAWWSFDSAREARYQRAEAHRQTVIAKDAAREAEMIKAIEEQSADELRQALAKKTDYENRTLADRRLNYSRS